jgi:hypothetical protein
MGVARHDESCAPSVKLRGPSLLFMSEHLKKGLVQFEFAFAFV